MKKVLLLGASALALGMGSTAAFADDPLKVTLSGTGQEWFGYASNSKDDVGNVSKAFAQSNNSFSLNGSTKLDNGITVGVSFTMNASPGTEGSQAHLTTAAGSATNSTAYAVGTGSPETNIVSFAGGFGQVSIGWQPNAALATGLDGPSFGVGGLSWGRWAGWVDGPAHNNLIAGSGVTSVYDDYWANKIEYATPTMAGFQVTASFTPNMAGVDSGASASGGTNGGWGGDSTSVALTYAGDFGAAKVKAQVAYTDEQFKSYVNPATASYSTGVAVVTASSLAAGGTVNGYQGGLSVSFGGLTIGGAVADREAGRSATEATKTALSEGLTYDVGVSYTMGPWGIAASYYTSQADNNEYVTGGHDTDHYYGVSFQYTLGPGITLDLENALVDYKIDDPGATSNVNKNNGWFSVLSTTVNF
ncbi:MAG TPA: porin [Magnetospirillaceae bacterium]|jgi:predicted porin